MQKHDAAKKEELSSVIMILRMWLGRGLSLLTGAFVGILLSALFQGGQAHRQVQTDSDSLNAPAALMHRSQ